MQSKKTVKWSVLVILLVLIMAAASPGAPFAQEPQFEPLVPCGDSASCSMASEAFSVTNSGTGAAIFGYNTSAISGAGVYGWATAGAGVRGRSSSGYGVFGASYNLAGVRARSTWGVGVTAKSVNNHGVYSEGGSGSGDYGGYFLGYGGLRAEATGYGYGLYATSVYSHSVFGISYDADGVRGTSIGGGIADNGVYGKTNSTDPAEAGVLGYATNSAAGVFGFNYDLDSDTTASYGVRAYSVHGHGVYSHGGSGSGDFGGYFTGFGGLRADATGTEPGYGAYVTSDDSEAGYFEASNDDGVHAVGNGSGFWGVWAISDQSYAVSANTNVSGGYGLWTDDKIYTGGGCVGCTSMLICQNGGDTPLEPGDVVAVVGISEEPTEFYGRPVLTVHKADGESSQGVVGVVEGRYVRQLLNKETARLETQYVEVPDPEGKSEPDRVPVEKLIEEEVVVEDAHTTTEPAAPGDYLTVVYRGLIQVKADATSGAIQVSDLLTSASASGWCAKAPATEATPRGAIIGKAMEPLAEGQGLIWVLVDLQ